MIKKFLRFLKIWDGLWSIPLAITLFIGIGYLISFFFGPEAGMMLPAYVQRLFYGVMAMVFINFFVWLGIYTNFPGIFKYYDEQEDTETGFPSNFNSLDKKEKIRWVVGIYFVYFILFIIVLIFA